MGADSKAEKALKRKRSFEREVVKDSATLTSTIGYVDSCGYPLPESPGNPDDVSWPGSVGDLTPDELSHQLTWWAGWASHVRYALASAETNETAFDKALKIEIQSRIVKSSGDYKNVTEAKAAASTSRDIQLLEAKLLRAQAQKKMLRALLEGYEAKYNTVSREMTRRAKELEESTRRQR